MCARLHELRGDAFAYDIYTQVARALRSPGEVDGLGGLEPERILAAGESQSAFALTTYINGVQPLVQQYDGFLVHSRGGPAFPLGDPGGGLDTASAIGGPATTILTDGEAPYPDRDVPGWLRPDGAGEFGQLSDTIARLKNILAEEGALERAGQAHEQRRALGVRSASSQTASTLAHPVSSC